MVANQNIAGQGVIVANPNYRRTNVAHTLPQSSHHVDNIQQPGPSHRIDNVGMPQRKQLKLVTQAVAEIFGDPPIQRLSCLTVTA